MTKGQNILVMGIKKLERKYYGIKENLESSGEPRGKYHHGIITSGISKYCTHIQFTGHLHR